MALSYFEGIKMEELAPFDKRFLQDAVKAVKIERLDDIVLDIVKDVKS